MQALSSILVLMEPALEQPAAFEAALPLARGFRGPVGVISDPSRPLVTAWAGEIGAEYNAGSLQLGLSFFQFNTANERIKDPVSLDVLAAGTSRRRGVSMTAALLIAGGAR